MADKSTKSRYNCSTFECHHHALNISQKLRAFYEQKKFFDVTLITQVDGVKVKANKLVLSASSDYFLSMSPIDFEADHITVANMDGDTLQSTVDFMYRGSIEFHSETVALVLKAADFLQMNTLISACCNFMEHQLDSCNCLGIAFFAEQLGYTEFYNKCLKFAYKHFESVCTEQEFLKLSPEQLNKFLFGASVRLASQEKLFNNLVSWFQHDETNRAKLISSFLSQHIRHELLDPQFIIENSESIRHIWECSELIYSWIRSHLSSGSRHSRKTEKLILTLSTAQDLIIQTYIPEVNKWSYEKWPHPSEERSLYGKVVINGKMIIAGGSINGAITNRVESFDLQTKQWSVLEPMSSERVWPCMVEIHGNLYVFGGFPKFELHSMEKYDFSTKKWQQLPPMPAGIAIEKFAVLNGILYISNCSGYHLDYYDPTTNEWGQTALKKKRTHQFGLAATNGHLYAFAGINKSNKKVKTVEMYSPSDREWTSVKSLEIERTMVCCVGWNDRLLVCGGVDNTGNFSNVVEEFNLQTNEWKTLAPFMLNLPDFSSDDPMHIILSVIR